MPMPNIEDSEDPGMDSYASPDVNRQLPFSSNTQIENNHEPQHHPGQADMSAAAGAMAAHE